MEPTAAGGDVARVREVGGAPRGRRSSVRAPVLAAAVAALGLATASFAGAPSAEQVRGVYRLHGTAHIDAGPVLSRDLEVRADARLAPGSRARAVRARLAAEGHACELDAALEEGGVLVFEARQRCAFDVDDPGARGRVEARLRSGRGRLRDDTLALELTWELSGALRLRTSEGVDVLGKAVGLPSAAWTPEIPVRGTARTLAEGHRDASRAAER